MGVSIFDIHKATDLVYYVEEVSGGTYLLNQKDFETEMQRNKFPDGTRATKLQINDKFMIITKKELLKVNGDKENSSDKKDL